MSFKNDASKLLKTIDNPRLQGEVSRIASQDPIEELRTEMVSFFKNRMESIKHSEKVKALALGELERKLNKGELEFDQLMTLLARLDIGQNTAADSIISMFRPTSTGQSPLAEIVRPNPEASELQKAFDGYTSEELQAIEQTMKYMQTIVEKSNSSDEVFEKDDENESSEEL